MDLQVMAQLLGNLGEFVGSLAILITLMYLARQVKLARDQQKAMTRQNREAALTDFQLRLATTPALAETVWKARSAFEEPPGEFIDTLVERGLTLSEAQQVFSFMVAGMRIQASMFYTSDDDELRDSVDSVLRNFYRSGLGAHFWASYSRAMPGDNSFRKHVDDLLTAHP